MACAVVFLAAPAAYPQKKEILQLQSDMIGLKQQMNQLQSSLDDKNKVLQSLVEKWQMDLFQGIGLLSHATQKDGDARGIVR